MAKKKTAKKTSSAVPKKVVKRKTSKQPLKKEVSEKKTTRKTAATMVKKVETVVEKKKNIVPTADKMVGKKIPKFELMNSQKEIISNKNFQGKKIILYFYPKDNTPGCTLEGQQFARMHREFVKLNCEIYGVSKDSVEAHDKFKCKYNFPFDLLSDESGVLCEAFDVIKEKNMYGKKFMGIERSTFIIDESGNIVREYRKISLAGHAEFILEEVKSLTV